MTAHAQGATRASFAGLQAAQPVWASVVTAHEALGLDGRWLLHAGPPLRDPCNPPPPLMSSAVLTCLHEGWASNPEQAQALVHQGHVVLRPAQSTGCMTPLAALISPGTPLIQVEDAAGTVPPWHAPLSPLGGPDTRMGSRDPRVLSLLAQRDSTVRSAFSAALGRTGPVPLLPLARTGLAEGDDLHNRTTAATTALSQALFGSSQPDLAQALQATPLFFLTVWMAASRVMSATLEHGPLGTAISRAGGNGEVFGLSVASQPHTWLTVAAQPPQGPRLPQADPQGQVCPAIGDSALIDLLGLGAQRLPLAPEPWAALSSHFPRGWASAQEAWFLGAHMALGSPGVPLGLDARAIARSGVTPQVVLAMIDGRGLAGLLGRGVYSPAAELFARAAHGHVD